MPSKTCEAAALQKPTAKVLPLHFQKSREPREAARERGLPRNCSATPHCDSTQLSMPSARGGVVWQ